MLILWNTYRFFIDLANVDGFVPADSEPVPLAERGVLDRWVLAELHTCVETATRELEAFDATGASRAIEEFVIDLSTWYVRRSRRRFWKSESDRDKLSAYQTLHEVLVTVARLLAPFTPFVAEDLYRNLTLGQAADSVHLAAWPEAEASLLDRELAAEMARVRRVVEMGHKERDRTNLKVRQPLAGATVPGPALSAELEAIVLDELNLKSLRYAEKDSREVQLDTNVSPELRLEGLAREIVRKIQGARREAGLNIEDRVELLWRADGELAAAVEKWGDHIRAETLGISMMRADAVPDGGWFVFESKVEGGDLWLALRKT